MPHHPLPPGLRTTFLLHFIGSWLASRETAWEHVRVVVWMQIAWSALGALVIAWGILFEAAPALEWLNVATLTGFAAAFSAFTLQMRRSP